MSGRINNNNPLVDQLVAGINWASVRGTLASGRVITAAQLGGAGRQIGQFKTLTVVGGDFIEQVGDAGIAKVSSTADYIELNLANPVNLQGEWTLSHLVQFNGSPGDQDHGLFGYTALDHFQIWADEFLGSLRLGVYDGTATYGGDLSDSSNQVYHIVVTKVGTTVTGYINGKAVLQDTGFTPPSSSSVLTMGGIYNGLKTSNAKLYQTAVWARVLNANEVRSFSNNPWQIFEPNVVWVAIPSYASAPSSGRLPRGYGIII